MKILVADDDALIRRLLQALLTKLGHEVELVEDGEAALKALASTHPPALAILDWVMPGLTGVEVCKRLRSYNTRSRTYIILLSAKADKQDVIAGLDAGADDYLPKPFDPMALLARLRVAQRIIAYQQELQSHIIDMETLLQRYNLLGEMFGKHGRGQASGAPEKTARDSQAAPVPAARSALLVPDRINAMLARSLGEVGLNGARLITRVEPPTSSEPAFTAWAPMVMVGEGLWIDLLLDADDASAVAMFESLLGRIPVSERELVDFLAETFNLVCTAIKTSLTEQGSVVLAPVISRSTRSAALSFRPPKTPDVSHHSASLKDIELSITVIRQLAPVEKKSLGQLHEMDILAENLPSPSTSEVFLLNQGVVLNQRYIEKLSSLARAAGKDLRVPVFSPSRLTEFFCLGRIRN